MAAAESWFSWRGYRVAITTVTMAVTVAAMAIPAVKGTVKSCFRKTVKKFDVLDHVFPRVIEATEIINYSHYSPSLIATLQRRTNKRHTKRTPQNGTTLPPYANIKLHEEKKDDIDV